VHITIATIGSRGDVQPYVALGQGLQRAGHRVQIAAEPTFADFIGGEGLGFASISAGLKKALQEDVNRVGRNPLRFMSWFENHFKPLARQLFCDLRAACTETDALLFSTFAFAAFHVAEALAIPALSLSLQPTTPTRAFGSPIVSPLPDWLPLRGQINWWGFRLSNLLFFRMIRGIVNECRQDILDLAPVPWKFYTSLDASGLPTIIGYSPTVVPPPPDWGNWLHTTGYWFLDRKADWEPQAGLAEFLEAGAPPVCVGIGSMMDRDVDAFTGLVVGALHRSGKRGILLGGWGETGAKGLPESILQLRECPHDWLFPQMAAVVHHGGAGTTAAGLRAGVPSVLVPFFADQPFWADRVYKLGVGPKPIPRSRLSADNLAHAICVATSDHGIRQRAHDLSERIRSEDGVGTAVGLIEHYLAAQRVA